MLLLRLRRDNHFPGEAATVVGANADGLSPEQLVAPSILYPLRNAVDYAVEVLTAIVRDKGVVGISGKG